jgi:hypothetical protein
MSTDPTRPDAASIDRGRLIAESMMDHATAAYRARLAEERSDAPRPPAEVHPGATGTPDPTTRRGTGEAGPETSAQAATLHQASASIHTIADHMPGRHPEFVRGVRYVATLLGHTADDTGAGDG